MVGRVALLSSLKPRQKHMNKWVIVLDNTENRGCVIGFNGQL